MTELSIRPEEIRDALQKYVADYRPEAASREEVGTDAEAGDGIARVTGLPSAMANELLEFEDGTLKVRGMLRLGAHTGDAEEVLQSVERLALARIDLL